MTVVPPVRRIALLRNHCLRGLLLFELALSPAALAEPALERELRSALSALPDAKARVGAYVIDLTTGRPVLALNATLPLTPASTMKVFAMAAALIELGPEFAFQTIFAADETNLYVVGGGDPAFGDEKLHRARSERITADFERWADALLERGISAVAGDLIIDESIFDDQWIHPSWDEDDLDNWYAAPVGGLNFNDNCIDITVAPADTPGAPVRVSFQPASSLVKIINKCRSGGNATPILHHRYDTYEYVVSGRCNKRWPFGPVSFPDPGLLFADSLRTVLAQKGISVAGTIRRRRVRTAAGKLPEALTVVATRATPLADVLRRAGKDSQNLFAECLLKSCGRARAQRSGSAYPRGTWELGAQAVVELLERAGIDGRGFTAADGSGLSRRNTCTARQLAELLEWMHGRPEGTLLYRSLSVAGVDGSLRKRLLDVPGRVHAKTGTMRGVRALAGYVDSGGRPKYAFAVLFNGYQGPSTPYKKIQDRICRILLDRG